MKGVKAKVYLMRLRGRPLPLREVRNSKPIVGTLLLSAKSSRVWGEVQVLEVLNAGSTLSDDYHLAALYCPTLEKLGHDHMVFRGYEAIKDGNEIRGYAQFWRCEVNTYFDTPDPRVKGPLPDMTGRMYDDPGEE